MDREQTPLKQRQKRGGSRASISSSASATGAAQSATASAAPSPARAFRTNGSTQRGRAKSSAGAPAPPLAILRAQPPGNSSTSDAHYPSSPSSAMAAPKTPTLYDPNARVTIPSRSPQQQPRNSTLRVNTMQSTYATGTLHASPMGSATTPQPLRKPSATSGSSGGVSGGLPPPAPSVLLRSSASSAAAPLVSAPPACTKLIHSNFHFASDIPTKLASCLELTNFTVVGTLGFEGVGKSTLLSLLAAMSFTVAPTTTLSSSLVDPLGGPHAPPFFAAQRIESQLARRQETQGVDLAVVCEAPRQRANLGGLVLLDTQPLLSASYLADVLSRNESSSSASQRDSLSASSSSRFSSSGGGGGSGSGGGGSGLSPEHQVELASIQIAILMLSVCHYVVVPQRTNSATVDLEMVALLRKVHTKMQQCRLPNVSGHVVKDKHQAQLLFVANETPVATANKNETNAMRVVERLLPTEWLYKPQTDPTETSQVPLYTVPSLDTSNSTASRSLASQRQALRFARLVESLPASPSFTTTPHASSAPTRPPPLTLKEWLSNTARVWESIKRSSALTEEYTTRDHY